MSPTFADSTARPPLPGAPPPVSPTLVELFLAFAGVSLIGFGGVLAWARRMMVERRKWMTAEEFNDIFALSQFLPGPNIVNLAVVYGARLHGWRGSVVAAVGLLGPPLVIVTLLGMLYLRFADVEILRRMLAGLAAAASGLIAATVLKMSAPLLRDRLSLAFAGVTFVLIALLRWPIPVALPIIMPLSLAANWWKWRRR